MSEAEAKHGFLEGMRIWCELAVTRFFDGMRFVVRYLVGAPRRESPAAPVEKRRRSRSENETGRPTGDVCAPKPSHSAIA